MYLASCESTTSRTRRYGDSAHTIIPTQSPRMQSSTMSTASCTHRAIGNALPTTWQRNCRVYRSLRISMPSPRPDKSWRLSISATIPARNTRWRRCFRTQGSRGRSISGSATGRCGLPMKRRLFSSSMSMCGWSTFRPRRMDIRSTEGHRLSGSSTATGSPGTRKAALSTIPMDGSRGCPGRCWNSAAARVTFYATCSPSVVSPRPRR